MGRFTAPPVYSGWFATALTRMSIGGYTNRMIGSIDEIDFGPFTSIWRRVFFAELVSKLRLRIMGFISNILDKTTGLGEETDNVSILHLWRILFFVRGSNSNILSASENQEQHYSSSAEATVFDCFDSCSEHVSIPPTVWKKDTSNACEDYTKSSSLAYDNLCVKTDATSCLYENCSFIIQECFHSQETSTHRGIVSSGVHSENNEYSKWTVGVRVIPSLCYFASFVIEESNVIFLQDFIALLLCFLSRHPSIGWSVLNPYKLTLVRRKHDELYSYCCDALDDADFMQTEGSNGPTMHFIRDIMRFAFSVYGLAYQSGFMSSVSWGILMRGLRRDLLRPDDTANTTAVAEMLGLPVSDVRLARWSYHVFEPSYCIIVEHATRRIVWAFRGTLSDGDLHTDICAHEYSFCGGYAHEGVARIVSALFDNRADTTTTTIPISSARNFFDGKIAPDDGIRVASELLSQYPDYEFVITGHSLGASIAILFGVRAIHENVFGNIGTKRMRIIAFGAMPVLTKSAAQSFENQIWSIVNGDDFACRLQLNSIDRLATQISELKTLFLITAGKEKNCVESESSTNTNSCNTSHGGFSNRLHKLLELTSMRTNSPKGPLKRRNLTEEMYHPGRVFMFTTPWQPKTNRLIELPCGHVLLHHLFVSPHMFQEHLMDRYTSAFKEVHLRYA